MAASFGDSFSSLGNWSCGQWCTLQSARCVCLLVTVVWCCWQAATSWCLVGDSPKIAKTILNVWIFDGVDVVDSIKSSTVGWTLAGRHWSLIIDFMVWIWSGRPWPSVGKLCVTYKITIGWWCECCSYLSQGGTCTAHTAQRVSVVTKHPTKWELRTINKVEICDVLNITVGRDSWVGTGTRFGLDGPGIEFRWGARFSAPV